MRTDIFNPQAYRSFADEIKGLHKRRNVRSLTLGELEPLAHASSFKTKQGSHVWRSAVSSRIGPKTVYLGSEAVRLPSPTPQHESIIEDAPATLEKVKHLLRTLPFVHLRRQMGDNSRFNPMCNLYVSVADPKNHRLPYMWGNTMGKPSRRPGYEFTMIHIPEEHHLHQRVLAIPEHDINICLGSDYMGEDKKGCLRQAMWRADQAGMLGLHAGTKMVTARDAESGGLKRWGAFFFGLSATGKSTWSCHQLGLDHKQGEETTILQDDIVFLDQDGSALGSEQGFYVKTDVMADQQEAMYTALMHRTALHENVACNHKGELDFQDENLCKNGRSIVFRDRMKVKRGARWIGLSGKSIDLPPLDEMDGVVFAFITRRNTIMNFAQELTPEQAVLAYLWGESTHSFATTPAKAGESVRVVGTDPFIVGSRAIKVNRFRDIVMGLVDRHPGKVKFMMYNTGGVGEVIEKKDGKKKMIRKVQRVPLDLMSAIQRGDLRGTNQYAPGILGTRALVKCENYDLSQYDPYRLYDEAVVKGHVQDLVDGRRKYTEEIAREGLDPDIIEAAERSFQIADAGKSFVSFAGTGGKAGAPAAREPVRRPTRRTGWRYL
jgi:phosphoenolpyruvate carboxykinase (ATP)